MRSSSYLVAVVSLACACVPPSVKRAEATELPPNAQLTERRGAPAVPVARWSGLYIGGHGGYGWAHSDWTFLNNSFWNFDPGERIDFSPRGFLGGGQIGFNQQIGQWVIGIEGTWSGARIRRTVISPFFPAEDTETTKIKQLFSIAGRVGMAWDRVLLYAKAG